MNYMSFLRLSHKRTFATILTVLFATAWLFCAVHVSADQTNHVDSASQTTHQHDSSSQDDHDENCLDHTPIHNTISHQNDLLDMPVMLSGLDNISLKAIEQGNGYAPLPSIFDDDYLQKRYTYLKNNTIRI